ncbi:MAG: enamine deaminase RidA [Gemmatimonadetes bacterium]|nr:MAG: enamine deaminase RidA [Gemmatimonadota bacterium]
MESLSGCEPMTFEIINPGAFGGRPSGWNHGMLAEKGGRILFVAGQIVPVGDFVTQWDGALGRVLEVVRAAGGRPENIGRMVVYTTDRPSYLANLTPLGVVHRKHMGRHYCAMAVVEVKSLMDSKALVEIEAVAIL